MRKPWEYNFLGGDFGRFKRRKNKHNSDIKNKFTHFRPKVVSCVLKYSPYWSACSSLSEECFATCAHCGGWSVNHWSPWCQCQCRACFHDWSCVGMLTYQEHNGHYYTGQSRERRIIRSAMDTFNAYYFINKSELLLHYQSRHLNFISDIILFCIKTSCLCSLVHITN